MSEKAPSRPIFSLKKTRREPSLTAQSTPHAARRVLVVAHNHPGFFPGGGEVLAYQLFELLRAQPHYEAFFLGATGRMSREAHPGTAFLAYDGRPDEYLFFGDNFDYFLQSQRQAEFLYRDFANFLRALKPDVVHFHHTLRIGVEALRIVRDTLPDARIVYTLHDFIPLCHRDGQMLRRFDDSLCEKASPARCHACFPDISSARFKLREQFIKTHFSLVDAFVSPSVMLAQRFAAWGLPDEKIHVIHNGTPALPPAPPRPIERDGLRNRFGFFGQISHYKGTLLLVEAARNLVERGITDFSVAIHGNLSLQPEAWQQRFLAEIENSHGTVQYHGRYDPAQLPQLMAEIDWVVVPSIWWENAPLVISEALRHGRPVICSDIGGMAEKIAHRQSGLHFTTGSAHSLADTMRYAMEEPRRWEELHQRITPPPSLEKCLEEYIQLYLQKSSMMLPRTA